MSFKDYLLNNTDKENVRYVLSMIPATQDYRSLELLFACKGLLNEFLNLWNAYSEELDLGRE